MKGHNRITVSISTAIVLLLISGNLFAQYPGMAAFRAQQNQQFINQQMNTQMQMMAMLNQGGQYNTKYTFVVTMADSSTKEVKSKIYFDTTLHKTYLLFVDKNLKKTDSNRTTKIYPSQTINIARNISTFETVMHGKSTGPTKVEYLNGKPADTCWMFKAITGAINVYSYLSEEDGQTFDRSTIVGIQLGNGPILKFNEENLKQLVGDEINALEFIQKKNYYKAIKKFNRDMEKELKKSEK